MGILSGLRLPASISFTSFALKFHIKRQKNRAPGRRARGKDTAFAAVQALAPQGGEIALGHALRTTRPVQTSALCLHSFAAATHIPAVALPTGQFDAGVLYFIFLPDVKVLGDLVKKDLSESLPPFQGRAHVV